MNVTTAKELISNIKSAIRRNKKTNRKVHVLDITYTDLIELYEKQQGRCYWTGIRLDQSYNKINYHPLGISVDRLDNDKGYLKDNLVLTIRLLNLGKNQYDAENFFEIIDILREEFRCQNYSKM